MESSVYQVVAGGLAGAAATLVTLPLDVIKTRLQSTQYVIPHNMTLNTGSHAHTWQQQTVPLHGQGVTVNGVSGPMRSAARMFPALRCMTDIYYMEGVRAFWKGLVPSLVATIPARAIYFYCYDDMRKTLFQYANVGHETEVSFAIHASIDFMGSFYAQAVSCTVMNPIFALKTRLQLLRSDQHRQHTSIRRCILDMYQREGLVAFSRGITASWIGCFGTATHFAIFETMKRSRNMDGRQSSTGAILDGFWLSALAKSISSTIWYPHEVIRTRLREPPTSGYKYIGFFQSFKLILREESWRGLFRGLPAHLVRAIPNGAITVGTYGLLTSTWK